MKPTDGPRCAEVAEPQIQRGYEQLLTSLSEHVMSGDKDIVRWIHSAYEAVLSRIVGLSAVLAPPASFNLARHWSMYNLRSVSALVSSSYRSTQSNLSVSVLCVAVTLTASWLCWLWRHSWLGIWWHITL